MYGYEIDSRIKELGVSNAEVGKFVGISGMEISRIRNNEKSVIRTDIFIKLMEYLGFEHTDFRGFVRIDLIDDLVDYEKFISDVKSLIYSNSFKLVDVSNYMGISSNYLYRILHGSRRTLAIDKFCLFCKYLGIDYREVLVSDKILASIEVDELIR